MGRPPKISREQVLQAAREAFAERGFEATTLASIASRLAVSPAALLRHAASKGELFSASLGAAAREEPLPFEFLSQMDGTEDPRQVLRRVALALVPFAERRVDAQIARFMHEKSGDRPLFLPSTGPPRPTAEQLRGFTTVTDYFRRAAERGRMRLDDPAAAALAFIGSLQSFVMMRRVVGLPEPPIELERYLDTLLQIWTAGAFAPECPASPEPAERGEKR